MNNLANSSGDVLTSLINFYNSPVFSVIKFIIGIYVTVLFVDIILLLVQRGLSGDIKQTRLGMDVPPEFVRKRPKDKLVQKWAKIKGRIYTNQEDQYKLAIIEADALVDDLIYRMGYKTGENFGERLNSINPGQIENIEDLKKAHLVRNRIVHDAGFSLTQDQAGEALAPFEDFLRYHGVFD